MPACASLRNQNGRSVTSGNANLLASVEVLCKYARAMSDDLLPTTAVAELLGKSVATINRWAQEKRLVPAVELPGETGARLYRRSDVEALLPAKPTEAAS